AVRPAHRALRLPTVPHLAAPCTCTRRTRQHETTKHDDLHMSETRIAPRPLPSVLLTSELTPHDLNQALSTGALTRVRHGAYTKFAAELTSFESREQRALAEAVA